MIESLKRPLFGYLGRLGLPQATAEEIAQESFLRAWQNLHRFDSARASFSTWLFTIARNLALNERARPHHRCEIANDAEAMNVASAAPLPPDLLIAAHARQNLQAAIAKRKPEHRRALALAYVQELNMADAAVIECCSTGTFKTRMHRARVGLRQLLENDHES